MSYALEPRTPVGRPAATSLPCLSTHDRQLWAIDATDGRPCAGFGEAAGCNSTVMKAWYRAKSAAPRHRWWRLVVVTGSTVIDFVRATTPRGTVMAFDSFSGQPLWHSDPCRGHAGSGSGSAARLGAHVGR